MAAQRRAQQPQRAEESVLKTAKYNAIFMAIVTVLFFITAPYIIGFFAEKEATKKIAIEAMLIISSGYIFYGIGMVMSNAFNGAGDTKTPTIINAIGFWLFQIPLAKPNRAVENNPRLLERKEFFVATMRRDKLLGHEIHCGARPCETQSRATSSPAPCSP